MSLNVLSVAYPFAPVRPDSVGGAEQVLRALDAGLVRARRRSIVLACSGSLVEGELRTPDASWTEIDDAARALVWAVWRREIANVQTREKPDVIHLHGIDFREYLPDGGCTVVTLHLPLDWYDPEALRPSRPDLWLHGVSESQHSRRPQGAHLLPPIPNGVDLNFYRPRGERTDHVLFLGRICPEKAPHLAIEAASRAGAPLILAGQVFAYDAHLRYFAEEVQPRLGPRARFEGPVGPARKQTLLAAARCLLVPSLAEETSSLAAMEALACGAPVVGFRRGALPEIVEHGRTGFIVDDVEEMASAIAECARLSSDLCRREAERRFSSQRMIEGYLSLYASILGRPGLAP